MHALALLTLLPAIALAVILDVDVGQSGLVFSPDTLTAAVGDTVVFHFYPGPHSVAQSTFDSPCQPSSGGIWSGTFSPTNGEDSNVFEVPIASTDPIWIYCAQVGHCNAGMAMVINPPSGGDTLAAYKSAAKNAQQVVPSNVQGGVVTPASAVSSGAGSVSETPSSTAASSPASSTASTSSAPASSASAASAATSTSASSSSAVPSSLSAASPPPATSAPSVPASISASGAGTATASSAIATFTGSSGRNTVNAFLAVAGAGAFGLAILY